MQAPQTLFDLLRQRASDSPGRGFRFTRDLFVTESLTYAELDQASRSVAAAIAEAKAGPGAPVLLLFAPGLDFIKALFGCFYAGVAAVPAYPPNPGRIKRSMARLRAIVQSCSPRFIVSSSDICGTAEAIISHVPELQSATWIAIDGRHTDPSNWRPPTLKPDDLAILQYTSGSTGEPRGVMVTHGNILHNQGLIGQAFASRAREDVVVSWLPVYHDMGLIGTTIHPVFLGCECVLLAPLEFLQSPYRWLAAISTYAGTVAGAPNFAYDLCARKISDEQLSSLDLSSWRVAFCGAEPVYKETLERFVERFSPRGFRRSAFLPCYGLAEATLIVSGASRPEGFIASAVDVDAYRNARLVASRDGSQSVIGCGPVLGDQQLLIVAEDKPCAQGGVGEIWLRGDSVGRGYFNDSAQSREIFEGRLADGTGPFLRTGDLGALGTDGELYIVGRIKDLLIVRGLNYHPQDIERSIEAALPAARQGCSVAFAVDGSAGEDLAVLLEYDPRASRGGVDWNAAVEAVRTAIAADHDLAVRTVLIAVAGEVPKTSSGKVRRNETRRRVLAGEVKLLHRWEAVVADPMPSKQIGHSQDDIADYIAMWLSRALGRAVGADAVFEEVGLDSLDAVRLTQALGKELGRELSATLAMDFPTIDLLAGHLASSLRRDLVSTASNDSQGG
ncbi:MAG TPA: AMP-binding protein [Allosphingosinicella sp.]|nr:AMP-binding protein [Allosphingosinicella sp.]